MNDIPFVPGLALSRHLYEDHVRSILEAGFPGLDYAAALIGPGSDVLGYDTPQSRDHAWGPRMLLLLSERDYAAYTVHIDRALRLQLPQTILGYPIDMAWHAHPDGPPPGGEGVDHKVNIHSLQSFLAGLLGRDLAQPLTPIDWLLLPEQLLLSVTAGAVFYDGPGELTAFQERLRYYPHDIWLYLLAAQWRRIAQEEAFAGRCAQVGDELGSRIVASRLARDMVRLAFLQARRYAPYIKWTGTAFGELPLSQELGPLLANLLAAEDWTGRDAALVAALECVARQHNALGLTEPLPAVATRFHDRPFRVIHGEDFSNALRRRMHDPAVLRLPPHLGSLDQVVDSTDVLSYPTGARLFKAIYE